jgi:23S rRNA (adenine2503-C2)-methyltransferase
MTTQANIRTLTLEELKNYLITINEKPFRAKQIMEWLWKKKACSFDEMTNLSKSLRQKLADDFIFPQLEISHRQVSRDGTIKFGFQLFDGHHIEGVLIPTTDRITACVSSQVGCSLTCKFCATGYLPMKRNLFPFEIFDQVVIIGNEAEREYGQSLSNIVYMGMGEPLLNYKNVLNSIYIITSPEGLGMSPRRITVSTAGIAKMIKKLGDENVKFEFALSLHAANDKKRNEIMPINESNSLEALADALKYFYEKTGTRVTYEYIIFDGFNDTLEDAKELSVFARIVPSKINIIEYNPIAEANYVNVKEERLNAFIRYLESRHHIVNVRRSRGRDVDGACGQLALKVKKVQ